MSFIHHVAVFSRMQSYIHGAGARGSCKEACSDIDDTGFYFHLIMLYECVLTKWCLRFHLICGLCTWMHVGRLGPAAKLSPGLGVYGWVAGNHLNCRDHAWHFQSVDHHRTARPILHHTLTGDAVVCRKALRSYCFIFVCIPNLYKYCVTFT